jgi:predicted dehydrogenase
VRRLKVAVIGVGHLGSIHARVLARASGVRLVGVVDCRAEVRARVADECRTTAFADHRELLGRIDAAVIATPTSEHHGVAMDLLRAGVHLLVEKPLALTSAEGEELVQSARQYGVLLQVGHIEQFNPALVPALPYAEEPKYIEAVRLTSFSGRSLDIGVVLDLMIHDLDVALSLVRSDVRSVEALGVSIFGGHEDIANARLHFANGCVASFTASRASYEGLRRMQVWSPGGFASIDFAARKTTIVCPSETIIRGELDWQRLSAREQSELRGRLFESHLRREEFLPPPCDQITAELEDFVDSIRSGRPPRVSGEQGLRALRVAERVLEAIATHCWDGTADGRVGPHAVPRSAIIPAPHFLRVPSQAPAERKEAG